MAAATCGTRSAALLAWTLPHRENKRSGHLACRVGDWGGRAGRLCRGDLERSPGGGGGDGGQGAPHSRAGPGRRRGCSLHCSIHPALRSGHRRVKAAAASSQWPGAAPSRRLLIGGRWGGRSRLPGGICLKGRGVDGALCAALTSAMSSAGHPDADLSEAPEERRFLRSAGGRCWGTVGRALARIG